VIVAIYARRRTDQTGVADKPRSVGRHVEHVRACVESIRADGTEGVRC
jgi:hypothetical protein